MKIGILCTEIYEKAKEISEYIVKKYGAINVKSKEDVKKIDAFVVLGGDGFMLRVLHNYYEFNIPFFGINYGNIGFLLNNLDCKNIDLVEKIENSESVSVNPLRSELIDVYDNVFIDFSFNELTLIRSLYKTCNINIKINSKSRLNNYVGDGLVICTPIGSAAYNSSVGGSIIPHNSNNIILSTVSPFRPRTFKSIILQNDSELEFEINYVNDRKISAFADYIEYKDVKYAKTKIDKSIDVKLLFDSFMPFDEKIIIEQFL